MFKIANPIPRLVTHVLCWLCLVALTSPAAALTTNWQHDPATPGDWFTADNWDNGIPTSSDYAYIDNEGTAQIASTGAKCEYLYLGYTVGHSGTLELSGETSSLESSSQYVGDSGTGTFIQTGGTNSVVSWLWVGRQVGSSGTYILSGTGQCAANIEVIGSMGTAGTFIQTGGTNTIQNALQLGLCKDSSGRYELSGTGQLLVDRIQIGCLGTGTFTQSGGTNTISNDLCLGLWSGSNGTYTISAGQLATPSLYVGYGGSGTLNITDPAASITVSSLLYFRRDGTLTAVPGSTIHMTSSAFENESTDADALAGLANLTLIFEGGSGDVDPFEVAGVDRGPVQEGFDGNFALDTLQLGGEAEIGQVQLVNLFDNQEGSEALYVENLLLGDGSLLDLNGLNLYYRTFTDFGGTIELNGGGMFLVPEPSVILLCIPLCFAGFFLGRWKKH